MSDHEPINDHESELSSPQSASFGEAALPGEAVPLSGAVPFSNEAIDPVDLPTVENETFSSVHPNHLKVRWIGDAIFGAFVVVGVIVALVFAPIASWIPIAVAVGLLALTALAAVIQKLEVGKLGYLVRERDFSFRQGVIFSNVKTMPYARVQHVSIDRGPIERLFGLATLTMKSAGGDVVVGGLPPDVADRLKALVVDRSGASADNELAYGDGGETAVEDLASNDSAISDLESGARPRARTNDDPVGDRGPDTRTVDPGSAAGASDPLL